MGATKFEAYTDKQIQYANFFKAFAHPARFAALENLIKASGEDVGFNELFDGIQIAQSTKSRHLKQMLNAGLLKTKMVTKNRKNCLRYRLNKPAIEFVEKFINYINENIDLDINEKRSFLEGFYSNYRDNLYWNSHFQT